MRVTFSVYNFFRVVDLTELSIYWSEKRDSYFIQWNTWYAVNVNQFRQVVYHSRDRRVRKDVDNGKLGCHQLGTLEEHRPRPHGRRTSFDVSIRAQQAISDTGRGLTVMGVLSLSPIRYHAGRYRVRVRSTHGNSVTSGRRPGWTWETCIVEANMEHGAYYEPSGSLMCRRCISWSM